MTEAFSGSPIEGGQENKRHFKYGWLVYFALGLFLLIFIWFVTFRPILVLPRITLAPGFSLIDQNGNRLTNEDQRGVITLYNITYTNCEPPCPQTSQVIQDVHGRLPELDTGGLPIEFVTISIDPERDTPENLKRFADSLTADSQQWHFLTGPADRLGWIVGSGFGFFYNHKADGEIVFDPGFILVDGLGIIRAEYRTASPGTDRILRDIQLLTDEVQNSAGAKKAAYEAAHLFMCYPRG